MAAGGAFVVLGGQLMSRRRRPMTIIPLAVFLLGAIAAQSSAPPAMRAAPFASDAEIRAILSDRVNAVSAGADGFAIVVATVGPEGQRIISYGHRDGNDARTVDGDTVFEIGSVGKVFTALLLANMADRGEIGLADPVGRYLPDFKIPSRGSRSITLVDLATHTSALPFMPGRSASTDADLRAFLAGYELPYDIGSRWEYSNLGYWLLGEALAARAKTGFRELLRARVIDRLKLRNTGFVLSSGMDSNLAPGHDGSLRPAAPLSTMPVYVIMPAAGAGLFSTANDLATLLAVAMGYHRSPLGAALAMTVKTRRPVAPNGDWQALGWRVSGPAGDELVFHDGGTLGYASCVTFDPARRTGVVVLSNQVASVADIARHVLRPAIALQHPAAAKHTEITLDARVLATYAGRYDAPGEGIFTIIIEDGHLAIESPEQWGLPPLRIRPESASDFFASELPLRVTFQKDAQGRVTGMLVYPPRGQAAVAARRIEPQP